MNRTPCRYRLVMRPMVSRGDDRHAASHAVQMKHDSMLHANIAWIRTSIGACFRCRPISIASFRKAKDRKACTAAQKISKQVRRSEA